MLQQFLDNRRTGTDVHSSVQAARDSLARKQREISARIESELAKKADEVIAENRQKFDDTASVVTPPKPQVSNSVAARKIVYLNYPYSEQTPPWALALKGILKDAGYLAFLPSEPVETQFEQEDLAHLQAAQPRCLPALCKLLKLPENLLLPITDSNVIPAIKRGDSGYDADALLFKEMFFLLRSSVVLVDVMRPPYALEVASKLFYCKVLDIPTIALSPGGQVAHPWLAKTVRVILTDELTPANIMPLVRGYAS